MSDEDQEKRLEEIRKRDLEKLSDDYIKKCLHVQWKVGERIILHFNPLTSVLAAIIIWGFVIYCINEPVSSKETLTGTKYWITDSWTWLYIGNQDVWAIFLLVLFFSKYSKLKLGRDDEEPEYPDGAYFTMLFSCGTGIGLFYYGIAEPIIHYRQTRNRYWGKSSDNAQAQDAINLTLFHWGVHGWVVYAIIGLVLGFLSYRRGLPMTTRTIFYPILGDKVFGRIGDLIDTLCIVCTMFGVCTTLGLGVMQLNAGFTSINANIPNNISTQLIIIWCVTALATISVISGIKVGIRRLSEICFGIGCMLLIIIMFADKTSYIANLLVQSIGYYFQYLIQLGSHTDAFAQLGIAPDKKENEAWMDDWTIFYWGWWISWSPFVGMFIAKISRGRTIREFITYTLAIPCTYSFIWFCTFGGSALRMQNEAENSNVTCDFYNTTIANDPAKYSSRALEIFSLYGVNRLECLSSTDMWFVFVRSYGKIEMFMAVFSLVAIILYFVTSSDSGSLVIDCISANGFGEPPVIQRIFWALTEGATATALLVAGGKDSLQALQSVSVICGLPFTLVINFTCVAIWRVVREEMGEIDPMYGKWATGAWDIDTKRKLKTILLSIPFPWLVLARVQMKLDKKDDLKSLICNCIFFAFPFYLWMVLLVCSAAIDGSFAYIGWAVLIIFFVFGSGVRTTIREKYDLEGNMVEDFFSFMLIYPLACMQVTEQLIQGASPSGKLNGHLEMDECNKLLVNSGGEPPV